MEKTRLKTTMLSQAISGILNEYAADLNTTASEIIEEIGKKTAANLRKTQPPKKRSGRYSKGWRYTMEKQPMRGYLSVSVYNATEPTLTHLLEHGHVLKRGGRQVGEVGPIPHIEPAQQEAEQELLKQLMEAIG